MRQTAYQLVFWTTLMKDMEKLSAECHECSIYKYMQTAEPIHLHEVPPHAWHTVGADIFEWKKSNCLMVVDQCSKYQVVKKLEGQSAEPLIDAFGEVVSLIGFPLRIASDRGTNFMSDSFQKFEAS